MSNVEIVKTKFIAGIWHGVVSGSGGSQTDEPLIEVIHDGKPIDCFSLVRSEVDAQQWDLEIKVPVECIGDGVQTLAITDARSGATLQNIVIFGGEDIDEDHRASLALLRGEVEMLKSAFRRHCNGA